MEKRKKRSIWAKFRINTTPKDKSMSDYHEIQRIPKLNIKSKRQK